VEKAPVARRTKRTTEIVGATMGLKVGETSEKIAVTKKERTAVSGDKKDIKGPFFILGKE